MEPYFEYLTDELFNKIISTDPDTDKSTAEKVAHIYKYGGYTMDIIAESKNGLDVFVEEIYRISKGGKYLTFDITEEQKSQLQEIVEEFHKNYMEEERDANDLARDPYSFYGTPRSFFLKY